MGIEVTEIAIAVTCSECSWSEKLLLLSDNVSDAKIEAIEILVDESNWSIKKGKYLCDDCNPDYILICKCCGKPMSEHSHGEANHVRGQIDG